MGEKKEKKRRELTSRTIKFVESTPLPLIDPSNYYNDGDYVTVIWSYSRWNYCSFVTDYTVCMFV